mmetsp:Transcript_30124/g.53398  ORF Transcript_30124/g.53398 Transcript_30124/m.53398 type:complete len:105 (+) Transcript_30124:41-355(+)
MVLLVGILLLQQASSLQVGPNLIFSNSAFECKDTFAGVVSQSFTLSVWVSFFDASTSYETVLELANASIAASMTVQRAFPNSIRLCSDSLCFNFNKQLKIFHWL